ncbi:hypothetical protein CCHR01_17990 [Colletotrichum chrysophilum]|uniref:Uncharacterized protein n=1 Tax=Colletotrichum chrysophilum TaxID=1836956 RepID=A0AAD9A0Z2_9PEZI|nr:hypothetical protein CCHR01_17990 [Colletotrichum chrysophilum]
MLADGRPGRRFRFCDALGAATMEGKTATAPILAGGERQPAAVLGPRGGDFRMQLLICLFGNGSRRGRQERSRLEPADRRHQTKARGEKVERVPEKFFLAVALFRQDGARRRGKPEDASGERTTDRTSHGGLDAREATFEFPMAAGCQVIVVDEREGESALVMQRSDGGGVETKRYPICWTSGGDLRSVQWVARFNSSGEGLDVVVRDGSGGVSDV